MKSIQMNNGKNRYSRIDTRLIDTLKVLAYKEKKTKEFRKRLRVKGRIIGKGNRQL